MYTNWVQNPRGVLMQVPQMFRHTIRRRRNDTVTKFVFALLTLITCPVAQAQLVSGDVSGAPAVTLICKPNRAILQITYSPLNLPLPRSMPVGDLTLDFLISPDGRTSGIRVRWTRSTWPEWDRAAIEVVRGAKFDPPAEICLQSMRLTFKLHQ